MDKGSIQMLSNKTKAQQYHTAMEMTNETLVNSRNDQFDYLLSNPDCEVTKGALKAIESVMADRFESMVLSQSVINKF